MTTELANIDKFKHVLGQLFDNIGVIIGDLNRIGKTDLNANMVNVLKTYIISQDKVYVITSFINNSYSYWKDIKNKNEKCMLDNSSIILGEYSNKPEFSSIKLIFSSHISNEDKDIIWDCIHSLIKLSLKYVYEEKGTSVTTKVDNGKKTLTISYKNKEKHSIVNIPESYKLWNLTF